MNILVLNWGVAREYSWQYHLFEELAFLGANIQVVSAQKSWEPRGGKVYPERERSHKGVQYMRIYKDLPEFKEKILQDAPSIASIGHRENIDIVMTFHQANFLAGREVAKRLGAKLVLVCEQAWRTSGLEAGNITSRWREIQRDCSLIISWSDVDQYHRDKIGVEYLPFGGCYPNMHLMPLTYKHKKTLTGYKGSGIVGIYQGSVGPHFKNQEAMEEDISRLLEDGVCGHFIVNGYLLDVTSQRIIRRLEKRYPTKFTHKVLVGRRNVLETLRYAMFGYSPMKPYMMSNFPIEAWGTGVPIYMPYITAPPDFVIKDYEQLKEVLADEKKYMEIVNKAIFHYSMYHSTASMGQNYFNHLEKVLR